MLCPNCFQEKSDGNVCSYCQFDESQETDVRHLPLRSTLKHDRYVIGRTLGRGGFGITYKAFDQGQYRAIVVIKECWLADSGHIVRADDHETVMVNTSFLDTYRKWLERFYDEAQHISRFQHPNIVRIIDFFYQNNTAYHVMPLVEGKDLREHLDSRGGRISERELIPIARGLIAALQSLHRERVIHRDIKPQNIILTEANGSPVLIDFGAARSKFLREDSLSHIGIRTEGYSPIEQITASADQGPWTDVYALCATFYRALAGRPPIAADKRFLNDGKDRYIPIETLAPTVSESVAHMINAGLAHNKKRRLQSATEMMNLIPVAGTTEDSVTKSPFGVMPRKDALPNFGAAIREGMASNKSTRRQHLLWFSPTVLALIGALGAANLANYLTEDFLAIFVVNFVAWAVYTATFRVQEPDRIVDSAFATVHSEPKLVANSKMVGTVRFLDNVMAGRVFALSPGQRIVVGRQDPSDVVIRNQHLSKQHAQITFINPEFEVVDLESTNGTFRLHYNKNNNQTTHQRITRYIGQGTFCLGRYDRDRMRFECSTSN